MNGDVTASSLLEFWRKLDDVVHPADEAIIAGHSHLFNLEYPPPAYIGDIENAPVILLNGNGGYKADITPSEFTTLESRHRHIERLHRPAPMSPDEVSSYYARANYAHWLKSGDLAMVNAIAYRSVGISNAIERLARKLPSTNLNIQWLTSEVIPAAKEGNRFVIAHRNRLWRLQRSGAIPGVYFTSNPRSEALSLEALSKIESFLARRKSN